MNVTSSLFNKSEYIQHFCEGANMSLLLPDGLLNRERVAANIELPLSRFVFPEQTHSSNVQVVTANDAGKGATSQETRIPNTDAIVTDAKNVCLCILTADCVPVLLYDAHRQVVAAIHAGWRGTVGEIVKKTILVMEQTFGTEPADIYAFVGPCICEKCFETSLEIANQIGVPFIVGESINQKPLVDLKKANYHQLMQCGVLHQNIEISNICTKHDNWPSFRRNHDDARLATGIVLKK